eukprot:scaffold1580_cov116-Cylindrotheca_fusiformis.AAC.11
MGQLSVETWQSTCILVYTVLAWPRQIQYEEKTRRVCFANEICVPSDAGKGRKGTHLEASLYLWQQDL